MASARSLIDAAYGRHTAFDTDALANDAELLAELNRLEGSLFAELAAPLYGTHGPPIGFALTGASTPGTPGGDGWILSGLVLRIAQITARTGGVAAVLTEGQLVHLVPHDLPDRTRSALPPRVYWRGGALRTVGETGDPNPATGVGDILEVAYASAPASTIGSTAADVDPQIPERYHGFYVASLAAYLATKDEAGEAAAAFRAEAEAVRQQLLTYARTLGAPLYATFARSR